MSDDPVSFRAATEQDHPGLVRTWRRAVEATHLFLDPSDIDGIEEQVRTTVLRSLTLTVAVRGGRPVGWIGVHGHRVEALFVDPAAHRQGVGTALLDAATAAESVVELDVNEQNPSALGFYTRHGFVQVGRSERDGEGRPFPLLHLRRDRAGHAAPPAEAGPRGGSSAVRSEQRARSPRSATPGGQTRRGIEEGP